MGCCESTEWDEEEENYYSNAPQIIRGPGQPVVNCAPTITRTADPLLTTQPVVNPVPTVRRTADPVLTTQPVVNHVPTIRTTTNPPRIWNIHELLAETEKIDTNSAKNIVHLFENENTIPFICRYRRDLIGRNITPDKLRNIKNAYTDIVDLRQKADMVVSQLHQAGVLIEETRSHILSVKTMKELEFLQTIYKPVSKDVRFYEDKAYNLLIGDRPPVQLECIVDRRDPDFDTYEKVKTILCSKISDYISKDTSVRGEWLRLQEVQKIVLSCTKVEVIPKDEQPGSDSAEFTSSHGNRNDQSNYRKYFHFEQEILNVKPHHVLAINRGEKQKFLTVHLKVSNETENYIKSHIRVIFMSKGIQYALRDEVFERAFTKCYTEKLLPFMYVQVRSRLTEAALKAQLSGFARNLKQLLLLPPLKGERILGIDPGFTNGCKLALISETADVLEVGVVYPHNEKNDPEKCGITLSKMLTKHCCKRIALGNGTGCRETEDWILKLFDKAILDRDSIVYDIVSERGASSYSCSKAARAEFPKMNLTIISAVSIARRLNDPLSEYVKINPRHLGIGMYLHDIDSKLLTNTLNEVISECVSYVGVDINTASITLLKHIAGLTERRAQNIIQYRRKNGPFRTRKDLLNVKTVGEKTFKQCAGFIRIEPKSIGGNLDNILDCTWVHPENYEAATTIINKCDLDIKDIGKPEFIFTIKMFAQSYSSERSSEFLAKYLDIPGERLQTVLEALQRDLFQDYRSDKIDGRPIFKKDITQIKDLFIGEIVTGEVSNIVDFGAFVDIGFNTKALIHQTKMNGIKLKIGDRVTTSVLDIDIDLNRVHLRLDELI